MTKQYKAVVIGCGSIGHAHMEGYRLNPNVDVVAVADPLESARGQYVQEYGIPRSYESYEEMLERERPDIVSVCTWHLHHPAPTIAAAKAGVQGVICEKPMAIGAGPADAMIEACEANGVKLVVSHQRRFTPGWAKARELIRDEAIGQPYRAECRVIEGLANWGTHAIDGSRFVLDDPKALWVMGAVERQTDRYERDVAIEDACMGLVQFERGIQLFIQSDLAREGADAGAFTIYGAEGILDINETRVRLLNGSSNGWAETSIDSAQAIGGATNGAQVRELIEWIEGGPEHRGSGRKARDTVEIMMAIYESARQHRVIHLPMEEEQYPLALMIEENKLPVTRPGRYDIRGFLKRDGVDEHEYARLRSQGQAHHQIMQQLHQSRP